MTAADVAVAAESDPKKSSAKKPAGRANSPAPKAHASGETTAKNGNGNATVASDASSSPAEAAKVAAVASSSAGGHGLSKKKLMLLTGACVAAVLAYAFKPMSKREFMQAVRDTLLSMQVLRDYGPLGWCVFVVMFVAMLTTCLPGTMVVDCAIGNIYGTIFGTLASLVAKLASALLAIAIGRRFGKAMGLEFPQAMKEKMATVRTHPFKCLLVARMTPISTGVKNYAFSLLPPDDVPLLQYSLAVVGANLIVTTSVCMMGANADNLVAALDQAMGGH